jgi:2-keto-4-pentenoate hydratase/2-oxohepta-3-ene-1,7-dioic acid hydratase in catechol pathway
VTPDEVGDLSKQTLTTRLNGHVVQQAPLSDMIFSIPEIISYCSEWTELRPGDILATGTPGGVGAAKTPPLWMTAGDVCEVSLPAIGVLSNPIIAESVLTL